ncbi:MAG TPA: response regulator transcription factor [Acidimicrobiales bacterium]|nr:response regulator transcription factor [Acidimicrobiales bacterium]
MADGDRIRVLVADDHQLFRRGLTMVLEAEDEIDVVGEADDGEVAVAKVRELRPDVVLMDVRMPGLDGIEATRQIHAAFPETRIIVLTVSDEQDDLLDAIKAGAIGYLLKEVSIEDVADAVRKVMGGESLLSPSMAAELLLELGSVSGQRDQQQLTDHELDVLRRVGLGMSNEEIARDLALSESEVRAELASILAKLQLRSRI